MMALDPFSYNNHLIRTAGTADVPLFCLNDVCDILNITNGKNKAARLCDDEKQLISIEAADNKVRLMTFITEMGLYNVALSCRGASIPGTAPFKFKRWITSDVLPTLRKTGEYSLKRKPDDELASLKLKASMMCAEKAEAIYAKAVAANDVRKADWAETLSNNALTTTLALCSGSNAPLAIEAPKVSAARTITELMADIGGEYATYKKQKERTKIGKSVSKAFREKHGTAPLTTRKRRGTRRTLTCTRKQTGAGSRRTLERHIDVVRNFLKIA